MWFNLASDKVNAAKTSFDEIAKHMTPAQIADGQRLTREWLAAHPKPAQ
jgi:hypothetical protein